MDSLGITSNIVFGIEACVQGKLQTSYSFDHWNGLGILEFIGMGIKKCMRKVGLLENEAALVGSLACTPASMPSSLNMMLHI